MSAEDDPWQTYKRSVARLGTKSLSVRKKGPSLAANPDRPPVSHKRRKESDPPLIDGKIDLHGMTQAEAHEKLRSFVTWHSSRGSKTLLVVTGKGREGQSVLRNNAPRWCEVPPLALSILALQPAVVQHGGEGAFYIVLKRRSSKGKT